MFHCIILSETSLRKVTDMKPETIELIRLIEDTKDKEKAILKAFAVMMDYLMPPESSGAASGAHPRSVDQTSLPS